MRALLMEPIKMLIVSLCSIELVQGTQYVKDTNGKISYLMGAYSY